MQSLWIILAFVLGLALGLFLMLRFLKAKIEQATLLAKSEAETQMATLRERLISREERLGEIQNELSVKDQSLQGIQSDLQQLQTLRAKTEETLLQERKASDEKLSLLQDAQLKLGDAFKALSGEALKSNNQSFLELAKSTLEKFQESAKGDLEKRQIAIDQLVKPVRESLEKFDGKIQDLEKARVGAYEGLQQQVRGLLETQVQLRTETSNLVKALGTPQVRGRWGEIQLRRVVEMAGMLNHCDFQEQQSVTVDGGRLRPDLIVRLPGGKNIVVDAKAPLAAYLEAIAAPDAETRKLKFMDHARQVRDHVTQLSKKSYWDQFQPAPEFVVLFLPGETFFGAALEHDPSLIETSVDQSVLLATPTTLIALLKAVAFGWRQESLAVNAQQISELGKEMYKRIATMSQSFADVGDRLGKAVSSYNDAVGSLESRVLVTARKFQDLQIGTDKEITPVLPIDKAVRNMQAAELQTKNLTVETDNPLIPLS